MPWLAGPLLKQPRTIGVWPPLMLFLWLAAAGAFAQPTDSDYRLGPGDRIIIKAFGEEDLSMDFRINDTRRLNYPFPGRLGGQACRAARREHRLPRGLKVPFSPSPAGQCPC